MPKKQPDRAAEIAAEAHADAMAASGWCRWEKASAREKRWRIGWMRAAIKALRAAGYTVTPPQAS